MISISPKQYEIWTADLDPSFGSEPGKVRPVVILQADAIHQAGHSSTIMCPVLSKVRSEFSLLRLMINASDDNGLKTSSFILADQIRAIDLNRLRERIGYLDEESIIRLQKSIKAILALH
ncbi:type II toxin-antitoxin system PemK/MazF family toxin [Pedobacter sp. HMF7647]|uniref:mRNA interferase n=1 Tax=Hufsiella arboris TaxID=2695275 RepID=A0A7K1YA90_9SPHI|nr:type II toxin-antitoxin system PemK/MazF family toxin [Hufsiella arboris]MXV51049.1 type II toxin-antitoxin system PemK/MazF family toxin [Hufsiella arboris]